MFTLHTPITSVQLGKEATYKTDDAIKLEKQLSDYYQDSDLHAIKRGLSWIVDLHSDHRCFPAIYTECLIETIELGMEPIGPRIPCFDTVWDAAFDRAQLLGRA